MLVPTGANRFWNKTFSEHKRGCMPVLNVRKDTLIYRSQCVTTLIEHNIDQKRNRVANRVPAGAVASNRVRCRDASIVLKVSLFAAPSGVQKQPLSTHNTDVVLQIAFRDADPHLWLQSKVMVPARVPRPLLTRCCLFKNQVTNLRLTESQTSQRT